MADGMRGHMEDTRAVIDTMMAEMSAHADAHAQHTDVNACIAAEEPHNTAMMGAVQDCLDAHDSMHDGVSCGNEGGMGM